MCVAACHCQELPLLSSWPHSLFCVTAHVAALLDFALCAKGSMALSENTATAPGFAVSLPPNLLWASAGIASYEQWLEMRP